MNNALARQEGGDHYKGQAIQPVQFWQANRWDGCACSIQKYLARHRRKNGLEDVRKAMHFVELRQELAGCLPPIPPSIIIPMSRFIVANGIDDPLDVQALMFLEEYVRAPVHSREAIAAFLIEAIENIIATYCAAD